MKKASPELIALLNTSQQFYMADLLTFTLTSGVVARYANYDIAITYLGNTFSPNTALFERSRVRTVLGVEVDTLDLNVYSRPTDTIGGVSWSKAAAAGLLDGAQVLLERVFMDSPPNVVGGYVNFSGSVADIDMTRTNIHITVKSTLELLNIKMPRRLYQAGCQHTLYDFDCGVDKTEFAQNASVLAGSTRTSINFSTLKDNGYFDLGYIEFTDGDMVGNKRTVKLHSSGTLALLYPLPLIPQVGDGFVVYAGCDKSQGTCTGKFNNVVNFRGFPYIPAPEQSR